MRRLLLMVAAALFFCVQVMAQNRTVTGRITDKQGRGLSNVSVVVKGTTAGTATAADGTYSISVPANARTLVFSTVGMEPREIAINGQSEISATLTEASANLQEVVVTGYTTTTRQKSTVSASVVSAKDIQNIPMTNVNDVLQGKAAGLYVTSTTGQPGGSSNIRVRGVGSISAGASPIYVIDGIVVERGQVINGLDGFTQNNDILSNLNPNDIESVTVLKDAAALALYGSRGGNGVIVINTRRGRTGASRINFTAQYGVTKPSLGNWSVMNAQQVFDYEKRVLELNGFSNAFINSYLTPDLLDKTFNWQDAAFVNGNVQSYDLSISGGNEKTKQMLSLGYYDQEGTVLNSGFKRMTANFNLDHQVSSRLKIGTGINASYSNTLNGDGGSYFSSPILATITNSPLWLYPYKEDGSLYVGYEDEFSKNSGNNITGDNFLYSTQRNYNRAKQFRALGRITAELRLTDWLSLKENAAVDIIYSREKNFFDPTTSNGINSTDPSQSGSIFEGVNNPITYTTQTSAQGTLHPLGNKHEVNYLALMEYQKYHNTDFYAQGDGIVDGRLQVLNVTGTPKVAAGGETEYSFLAYLGQVNYSYNNKYTVSGTLRRDGSSRFGSENRFATFWSVGASWRLTNETFLQNQSWANDLRIRGSYGTSGVAEFLDAAGIVNNYAARQLYAYGTTYNGAPGSSPSTPGNPQLSWEKNKQLDLGLEFSLFSRVKGSFDWYRRISDDLLQNVPVTRTSGFASIQRNVGKLENRGVELTINSTNIASKNFTWTTDLNISHNRNRVLKLNGGQDIPGGTLARTREGHVLSEWFLPVWAGVDPANGDPLWYLADGKTTTNNYTTASRTENRQFVGTSLPKYTAGLSNTIAYSGISFSFFLYASYGGKTYDQSLSFADADAQRFGWNYYKDADKNYWTTPGQNAERPKPVIGGNKNSNAASTRWLESSDYIRLRNVTLSYSLPRQLITRAKFSSVRLFVNGTNLLTFTNFKGVDPESSITGNDFFKYPVNKSLTFGIDIGL